MALISKRVEIYAYKRVDGDGISCTDSIDLHALKTLAITCDQTY